MRSLIEVLVGAILGVLVLVDIFLIVLYARTSTGLISRMVAHTVWRAFVWVGRRLGGWKNRFLTLAGPITLITVLMVWGLLLSLAAALIIHPNLGMGVRATSGPTSTDFLTALYVGGTSLSFVGATDFEPETPAFRLFYLVTSLIGVSMVSLTITYLMQLYGDLLTRNAYGLRVHLLSGQTGDAAEVITRLAPRGKWDSGYQIMADWAGQMPRVKESHAFYDMLFYFRFREAYFSVSRYCLTSMDTATLIRTALDEKEYGWLKRSAALAQLEGGTVLMLQTLAQVFVPDANIDEPPDEHTRELWRRRFEAAVRTFEQAGMKTNASGADQYIELRTKWNRYISLVAPKYAYDMDEIDTALAQVQKKPQA